MPVLFFPFPVSTKPDEGGNQIPHDQLITVVGAIFSLGGAAFLGAVWQGFRGYTKVRAQHIEDISAWRAELAAQVSELRALIDYYRSVSADYAYQLRSHGIKPETTAVMPPNRIYPQEDVN